MMSTLSYQKKAKASCVNGVVSPFVPGIPKCAKAHGAKMDKEYSFVPPQYQRNILFVIVATLRTFCDCIETLEDPLLTTNDHVAEATLLAKYKNLHL